MSNHTKRLSRLEKFVTLFFLMLGVMFAGFIAAIFAKFGWPKDIVDWLVIGGHAILSGFFFTSAYLEKNYQKCKISQQ